MDLYLEARRPLTPCRAIVVGMAEDVVEEVVEGEGITTVVSQNDISPLPRAELNAVLYQPHLLRRLLRLKFRLLAQLPQIYRFRPRPKHSLRAHFLEFQSQQLPVHIQHVRYQLRFSGLIQTL